MSELLIKFPNDEIRDIFFKLMEDDLENAIYSAMEEGGGVHVDLISWEKNGSSPHYEGEIPVITIEGRIE